MLWSVIIFVFAFLPPRLMNGVADPLGPLWRILWEPLYTIWFIYALFVAVCLLMLLRRVPLIWILVGASAAAAISMAYRVPGQGDLNLLEKVVRLFPFMVAGLMCFEYLNTRPTRIIRLWWVALGVFLAAALLFVTLEMASRQHVAYGVFRLAISFTGIFGAVLMCQRLAETRANGFLAYIGGASLYVFLMHQIGLFVLKNTLELSGIYDRSAYSPGQFVVIAGCLVMIVGLAALGRALASGPGKAMFAIPDGLRLKTVPLFK